ncbi:hypothetical protein H8S20_07505 [Clostridium sp. NSJ-6]|uniref:TerB family tellurite resistance protein n=1 Tax=Clostridium hominis TaxID=2763036 RepID=A0ABR7DBL4_9CLOT|nr:hypothetical protein [Clostridium hominis]MBC5628732.1 hypothetical protein [Clostridium hominis]MDU2674049.1 hypothetical protein [Clostridium sp.]
MNINEILKTEESKKNFLIGLVFLAKVDGNIDETEKYFFLNAAEGLQLSEESQNAVNLSWSQEIMSELKFENNREKLFFLMQGIQLSNIDNSYSDKERSFIYKVASDLAISNESVERIEAWVEEGIKWQNEGIKLLDLEG